MKKYLTIGLLPFALIGCSQESAPSEDINPRLEALEARLKLMESDLSSLSENQPLVEFEASLDQILVEEEVSAK